MSPLDPSAIVCQLRDNGQVKISRDPAALATSLDWARAEGWNPGLSDQPAFAAIDPDGWFTARDHADNIATTLGAVRYDDSFGFIGLYITRPESRGQGIGRQVWAVGREHLADITCVGLDAVVEREATYASDGFIRSHETTRFIGTVGALGGALPSRTGSKDQQELAIVSASTIGGQELSNFELNQRLFPAPRASFIDEWIKQPDSVANVLTDSTGQIQAWGQVRRSVDGWRVGPLFAQNLDQALLLCRSLVALLDDGAVMSIDVPDANTEAIGFLAAAGFAPTFTCVRMYLGEPVHLDLSKVFGNTTFELG